ncbi:cytochrome C [Thermosulfuriphilus ammonigenes]|uniref:Cytochrome C n=1 Tax=Thermosulfuriphilus ammonigenes TaxID=1936021 RepID=A0A6G7PTR3_9BACT|nr:cytochrome ubiquinol oxidase subunit I [Thermosulfuriphilus ammonigenes]MBA2848871.1 cytochrome bd-type quinol oxidase subunit 1 [Thermosulfuriphilus ammonigenes]QIJ71010.1 cytochrome C [Thermosulfuriphilus ammonigenes]
MYPIWELPSITSALVIAIVASFHILPSHLATGAFWFNVYIERRAYYEGRPELKEFLKRYTLLILVFCFVIGSLTGVGIWFAATLASPRSISALIHNYVWGWATEWVFFLIEVVVIYVYYYTLDKVDDQTHLRLGWIYAWAAWISMVIITGILAFMLTPDRWLQTGSFFDGFFNSTYWPQLLARTFLMLAIASLYATIVAATIKNQSVRLEITKQASLWGMAGLLGGALFALWYLRSLPPEAKELAFDGSLAYLKVLLKVAVAVYGVVFAYFLFFGLLRPQMIRIPLGLIMLLVLFAGIGAGEGFREGVRRPYVINKYMYGNQIIAHSVKAKGVNEELTRFKEEGFLKSVYFRPQEDLNDPQAQLALGRVIVLHQCSNCHSLKRGGLLRPIPDLLERLGLTSAEDIYGLLEALGDYPYMPPFAGTEAEKEAAAAYLATLVE